ncbi:hypothetical protein [Streptomyces sp. NPDC005799]|uniref:hypothetical protein n=1 Tax=Streptomyces sp. NPDC005799 TaxID=3154678 RepID=UPI0033C9F6E9
MTGVTILPEPRTRREENPGSAFHPSDIGVLYAALSAGGLLAALFSGLFTRVASSRRGDRRLDRRMGGGLAHGTAGAVFGTTWTITGGGLLTLAVAVAVLLLSPVR